MDRADPDIRQAEKLILDADTSKRGWRRRAVGTTRHAALSEVPLVGTLQAQIPIEPLRDIQRHIQRHGINQARWVREAIVNQYLREGGSPDVGEQALAMRIDHRRHDVPRDQYGQDRGREGRKR